MDFQERKRLIQNTFDMVAESYDNPALRFFETSAQCFADLMELEGDEDLLDVASGTGAATFAFAARLPRGQVTGIDFAKTMLSFSREKAKSKGVGNVKFIHMDIEHMDLPSESFDAACCSFGIFFLEDMARGLEHIAGKLRPGGRIGISSFSDSAFSPLAELFIDRIRSYGIEVPSLLWKRLSNEEEISKLFNAAGLKKIEVHKKDLSYFLKDFDQWWQFLWSAGFRGFINKISDKDLDRFRSEHQEEISRHITEQGIFLRVETLYGVGEK